jgi:hypothetical protein
MAQEFNMKYLFISRLFILSVSDFLDVGGVLPPTAKKSGFFVPGDQPGTRERYDLRDYGSL